MAKIQDNTNRIKPKISSYFLGCFGFSNKISKKKISHDVPKSSTRKNTSWLSLSRFRSKKSIGKTVPINITTPDNNNKSIEIRTIKSEEIVPVSSPDQNVIENPRKTHEEVHVVLATQKTVDLVKGRNTCLRELLSTRKNEAKTTVSSQPCSPDNRSKVRISTKNLSRMVSLHKQKPKSKIKRDMLAGKLNPVIGMSTIMVTLIIMILWGKVCAILCTSAWLYCVPRLKKPVESNVISVKNELIPNDQVNSDDYKKKVVLEGLLQRKHRKVIRFS